MIVFIAGEDKIKAIKEHFPQVLAVEMEGAAIAQAAHVLNLPFLVVRAMSDNANHEASISFDEFIVRSWPSLRSGALDTFTINS